MVSVDVRKMWIRLRRIIALAELIGLPKDPALFDRSDAIEVLEEILPTMGLTHYRNLWDPSLALRDVLTGISPLSPLIS